MLDVKDLYFSYGNKKLLRGVSFSVRPGEIVALIGMSGSGKTTLFKLIARLMQPTSGTLEAEDTTYMQQEDLLLPWRNVMGNLVLFTELGRVQKGLQLKAAELLERVGLSGVEHLFPHELSGGMRQRVALARALLQNRPLMLLDEPFASLDVILREQLYTLLRDIRDEYQKTMVMVTHDFRDAVALADRILVLVNGKIVPLDLPSPTSSDALLTQIRDVLALQST